MVIRSEPSMKIKREAVKQGMRTLRMDGMEKVRLGMTTMEEVLRITQLDVESVI
jgi:type II secretory ATPase GspE/PulE/Tfp pilus assembly ATPase PilB-like protein